MNKIISILVAVSALVASPADAYCYRPHGCASHGYYMSSDHYRVHGPDYNTRGVSAHCNDAK